MKEKEEIKVIKEETTNKKNKSNKGLYISIVFIIIVLVSFLIALNNIGVLKVNNLLPTRKKAELNYTETNTKIKEGIYITDVSEVVEEVMPSIVAITSKTLVKSGFFGPFSSQGQYQEGAGSGIIVSKTDTELLVLTNNHVIENAEELSVQFVNDKRCYEISYERSEHLSFPKA